MWLLCGHACVYVVARLEVKLCQTETITGSWTQTWEVLLCFPGHLGCLYTLQMCPQRRGLVVSAETEFESMLELSDLLSDLERDGLNLVEQENQVLWGGQTWIKD